jgi:hypothetical protein
MNETIRVYDNIRFLQIEAEKIENWNTADATHIRILIPATLENQITMQKNGFVFIDRSINVSINLQQIKKDYSKSIRMPIVQSGEYSDDIFRIASESFLEDRRFRLTQKENKKITLNVLKEWVDNLTEPYLCFHKSEVIGFLALKEIAPKRSFVHLAAVSEKYRISGAAMSLYANAVKECIEKEYDSLEGCISSSNTAVLNLYAHFGATFSKPTDFFLKEVVT